MEQKNKQENISFDDFISGRILVKDWLIKHVWYILFCVILSVIYIWNSYQTEKVLYEINNLQQDIKDLRNTSINFTVELQKAGRILEVQKGLDEKGIEIQSIKSPITEIIVEKEKDNK